MEGGRGRKEEGRNSGKGVRDGKRKVREGQGIEKMRERRIEGRKGERKGRRGREEGKDEGRMKGKCNGVRKWEGGERGGRGRDGLGE